MWAPSRMGTAAAAAARVSAASQASSMSSGSSRSDAEPVLGGGPGPLVRPSRSASSTRLSMMAPSATAPATPDGPRAPPPAASARPRMDAGGGRRQLVGVARRPADRELARRAQAPLLDQGATRHRDGAPASAASRRSLARHEQLRARVGRSARPAPRARGIATPATSASARRALRRPPIMAAGARGRAACPGRCPVDPRPAAQDPVAAVLLRATAAARCPWAGAAGPGARPRRSRPPVTDE